MRERFLLTAVYFFYVRQKLLKNMRRPRGSNPEPTNSRINVVLAGLPGLRVRVQMRAQDQHKGRVQEG